VPKTLIKIELSEDATDPEMLDRCGFTAASALLLLRGGGGSTRMGEGAETDGDVF